MTGLIPSGSSTGWPPSWAPPGRRGAGRAPRPPRPAPRPGGGPAFELTPTDALLLTVVWLRHYPTCELLGYLFGVSKPTASRTIAAALPLLEAAGRDTIRRPDPGRYGRRNLAELLERVPELAAAAAPPRPAAAALAAAALVDTFEQAGAAAAAAGRGGPVVQRQEAAAHRQDAGGGVRADRVDRRRLRRRGRAVLGRDAAGRLGVWRGGCTRSWS